MNLSMSSHKRLPVTMWVKHRQVHSTQPEIKGNFECWNLGINTDAKEWREAERGKEDGSEFLRSSYIMPILLEFG